MQMRLRPAGHLVPSGYLSGLIFARKFSVNAIALASQLKVRGLLSHDSRPLVFQGRRVDAGLVSSDKVREI